MKLPATGLPRGKPGRPAPPAKGSRGFSLLEVLIALAVLAILGTVTLRGIHQTQDILFEDDWRDTAVREGRNMLYEIRLGAKATASGGTFAPRHPGMHWRLTSRDLASGRGTCLVMHIFERQGTRNYEVAIESFTATPYTRDQKP